MTQYWDDGPVIRVAVSELPIYECTSVPVLQSQDCTCYIRQELPDLQVLAPGPQALPYCLLTYCPRVRFQRAGKATYVPSTHNSQHGQSVFVSSEGMRSRDQLHGSLSPLLHRLPINSPEVQLQIILYLEGQTSKSRVQGSHTIAPFSFPNHT